jgi:cyclin-dependent kinase 7
MDLAEQINLEEKNKWVKGKKLGAGTYANVYLGHNRTDPSILVAIKKIKVQTDYKEGMTPDAVRELKCLQELSHPNIIELKSVFASKGQNISLVLEYLPLGDLEELIKDTDGVRYGAADIKAWMGMLGRAVWWCHENFILHRDIKPNNLLIAADGEVKLGDFGLARSFADPYKRMTSMVITRWYRPPELLFGANHYSGAVDIWSVGCVLAELVLRVPYMAADSDADQITKICQGVGTPTEENWPGVSKLPTYLVPDPPDPKNLTQPRDFFMGLFGTIGSDGVDLLMKTLVLDPRRRITARQFLEHAWWSAEPKPTRKEELPKKAGGDAKMGKDLARMPGEIRDENERPRPTVARKLDFGAMR